MVAIPGFNANNVEPAQPQQAIPDGEYVAIIEDTSQQPTKDARQGKNNNMLLVVKCQIADGEFRGRSVKDYLNIWNDSQESAEIASRTLSSICRAVGMPEPGDTQRIHGLRLTIVVRSEMYNGRLVPRIDDYKPSGGAPGQQAQPQYQQPGQQPVQQSAPPAFQQQPAQGYAQPQGALPQGGPPLQQPPVPQPMAVSPQPGQAPPPAVAMQPGQQQPPGFLQAPPGPHPPSEYSQPIPQQQQQLPQDPNAQLQQAAPPTASPWSTPNG